MFTTNLQSIFKETYYLVSKGGFDAMYVENLPPLERQIYLIYIKEDNKTENKQGTNIDGSSINVPTN